MKANQNNKVYFHPLVNRWFVEKIGQPTPIQEKAWPQIASSRHVLITSPTGSGKTLAAFLWALNQLIDGRWESGETRVLYISPLKALNNDVQKNLIRPLKQLQQVFAKEKAPFPLIRVTTRSGDTTQSRRRQMIRRPPEILITTPESLHLMLSSHGGRSILGGLKTVIMDEIHAVIGNKRGTLLISAVDRLVPLCGEFQRVALSATVNPVTTVARFVGGYRIEGDPTDPLYLPRPVELCRATSLQTVDVDVHLAESILAGQGTNGIWAGLADHFRKVIERYRSTILFVNSRRLCEKLAFLINAKGSDPIAYAHHGSLSKELRLDVEQRLKKGELKAIVATASLELGIDIGSLDHVILVQSPPSVSSALQRIGRSGHSVGEISRATIIPTHAIDTLNAAVLARMVIEKKIEPIRPVQCPLDVLAQVMIAMVGIFPWNMDELYSTIRTSYPFHKLQRTAFDLVSEMLAGRYASTRIPSLKPKFAIDRIDNTVTIRKGALLDLYSSGGVIPDRGYFALRHQETGSRIGELDEEFVWEAKKGQVFTLGTQNWRIEKITHNDVFVRPANPKVPAPPFWRAEEANRDFHLSDKIAGFLEDAQEQGDHSDFVEKLTTRYHMDVEGARFLIDFFKRQQEKTGCRLPHRHHVVVEWMPSEKGGEATNQVVIHTVWGGRVNRPYALALEAAWEKNRGYVPSIFPTNDALYILLPPEVDKEDILTWVGTDTVESLIRKRLEGSGLFGARFRECAARALLLPRRSFNHRMPLWLSRQKSQQLLDVVGRSEDFPILIETWRTCLHDDFDMSALKQVLSELENGEITWSEVRTDSPSPMALSGSWRLVNQYMYADDRQQGKVKTGLSQDLLQQVVFTPHLRPAVDPAVVEEFTKKRLRLHPGYAPDTSLELLEWVKERLLITVEEWNLLLECCVKESGGSQTKLLVPISEKLLRLVMKTSVQPERHIIVAAENAFHISECLYAGCKNVRWFSFDGEPVKPILLSNCGDNETRRGAMDIVAQWVRYYGPVPPDFIREQLGLDEEVLSGILSELLETRAIISGPLILGQEGESICDAKNFDSSLRIARRRQMPEIRPRDIREMPPILALYQKVLLSGTAVKNLVDRLQPLLGYPLPAALWETEILPARLFDYDPQWMDSLMRDTGLMWKGGVGKKVMFCHEDDLDLIDDTAVVDSKVSNPADGTLSQISRLFPDSRGRYRLTDLLGGCEKPARYIRRLLWEGVWAGIVTNDSLLALRQEVRKGSKKRDRKDVGRTPAFLVPRPSSLRQRKKGIHRIEPSVGTWRMIGQPDPPRGVMEIEELSKDRVRLLLDRYGILFHQLLVKESSVFQWSAIFRALRLMELSGEVVAGYFFTGIPGLQFVSKRMLQLLQKYETKDSIFWINAQDPISICGLGLDELKGQLPRRLAGNHLVYCGNRLVLVSQKKGRAVTIHLSVNDDRLDACLSVFDHLLKRRIDPMPSITVETINEEDSVDSPFLDVFKRKFDVLTEAGAVTLYRSL